MAKKKTTIEVSHVRRGHAFIAAIARGGKHQDKRRKKPRTEKESCLDVQTEDEKDTPCPPAT